MSIVSTVYPSSTPAVSTTLLMLSPRTVTARPRSTISPTIHADRPLEGKRQGVITATLRTGVRVAQGAGHDRDGALIGCASLCEQPERQGASSIPPRHGLKSGAQCFKSD